MSNVHKQPGVLQYLFWCFTLSLEKILSACCRNTPSIFNSHHRHSALCLAHHYSFTGSKASISLFKAIFQNLCMCLSKNVTAIIVVNSLRLCKDNFKLKIEDYSLVNKRLAQGNNSYLWHHTAENNLDNLRIWVFCCCALTTTFGEEMLF